MRTWTFIHVDGEHSTVRAKDETTARDAAMRLRWGPPSGMYGNAYRGAGLTLLPT